MHGDEAHTHADGGGGGDNFIRPELKAYFEAAYGTRVAAATAARHRERLLAHDRRPPVRFLEVRTRAGDESPHGRRLGRWFAATAAAAAVFGLAQWAALPGPTDGSGGSVVVPLSALDDAYARRALAEAQTRLALADLVMGEHPERVPPLLEDALGALERAERLAGGGSAHLTQEARSNVQARASALAAALDGNARQRAEAVAERLDSQSTEGRSPRRRTPGERAVAEATPETSTEDADGAADERVEEAEAVADVPEVAEAEAGNEESDAAASRTPPAEGAGETTDDPAGSQNGGEDLGADGSNEAGATEAGVNDPVGDPPTPDVGRGPGDAHSADPDSTKADCRRDPDHREADSVHADDQETDEGDADCRTAGRSEAGAPDGGDDDPSA